MKLETITKLEMTHLKLNRPQQINARCKISASLWSFIIKISPFLPNYKKKMPLLKEYYKGEIYQHPITHNRTIILSKPPRVVNNCNVSDKKYKGNNPKQNAKEPQIIFLPAQFCLHQYIEHHHISRDPLVACQMEAWEAFPSHPLEGVALQNLLPCLALVEQAKPMAAAVHTYSAINQ